MFSVILLGDGCRSTAYSCRNCARNFVIFGRWWKGRTVYLAFSYVTVQDIAHQFLILQPNMCSFPSSSENDEPLLSGSGDVSKECEGDILETWGDMLAKWRQNLSTRNSCTSSAGR